MIPTTATATTVRPRLRAHRRGSIYVIVLGAALVVTVIGLSSILAARLQLRAAVETEDAVKARTYAYAAVDHGLLVIKQSPTGWRSMAAIGAFPTNEPIGTGTYSVVADDPDDGDLTDNVNDPVLLTGIGEAGAALYMVEVRLGGNGSPVAGTWRRKVN